MDRRSALPPPSPRPDLGASRTSRPAVRISRLRPPSTPDGRWSTLQPSPVPPPLASAGVAPNSDLLAPSLNRARSVSEPSNLRAPQSRGARDRRPATADDEDDQPGAVLDLERDARGQPHLTPIPPAVVIHPEPTNTVPIPPTEPGDDLLAATTAVDANAGDQHNRWNWLHIPSLRRRDRDSDLDSARIRLEPNDDDASYQYADDVVDWLDVIDPQVATVSTLSNVQNSLFVPDIGLVNRMPLITLRRECAECGVSHTGAHKRPPHGAEQAHSAALQAAANLPSPIPEDEAEVEGEGEKRKKRRKGRGRTVAHAAPEKDETPVDKDDQTAASQSSSALSAASSSSASSISSEEEMRRRERLLRTSETVKGEYAVLPAGLAWDDWTEEERAELDDYVRHLLHSRRERIRRRIRGFIQFVSRPLGAFITIYAFLITFWGAAWVLFLIGWIYVGDRRSYFVEICEQILTALFCLVGIGMAPFRAVDTYHMLYIVHYHRLTLKLRKKRNMPKLADKNDLPVPNPAILDPDLEAQFAQDAEEVLTPKQHASFVNHQRKYHRSHTFYRPHETPTHRAFPLSLLIAITVLLDCHSLFQMALGGTTWGISYHHRPPELTAIILSFSISCNITAGVLISVGGRKTRKVEEVEKRLRQALTEEAMRNLGKGKKGHRRRKEAEGSYELNPIEKVKSRVDDIKERHMDRRDSSDSSDPLQDRKARWRERAEASRAMVTNKSSKHGSRASSVARGERETPARSYSETPKRSYSYTDTPSGTNVGGRPSLSDMPSRTYAETPRRSLSITPGMSRSVSEGI